MNIHIYQFLSKYSLSTEIYKLNVVQNEPPRSS